MPSRDGPSLRSPIISYSTGADERGKKRSRQRPGAACLECRNKKLKCDGKLPACGKCLDTGVACTGPATQEPRGPKRGHLKALQSKIGEPDPVRCFAWPASIKRLTGS